MKQFFALLTGLTLIYIMTVVFANSIADDLSQNIIRLHIIANSNSDEDQSVKLEIRDEILKSGITIEDRKSSFENLRKIENIANKTLKKHGYSYGANAMLGYFKIPRKSYGRITLPEGNYNSVRVVLGKGFGENWWCILSPPACFIDTTVKFDENTLKTRLSDETYMIISNDKKYKLKIIELVKKIL